MPQCMLRLYCSCPPCCNLPVVCRSSCDDWPPKPAPGSGNPMPCSDEKLAMLHQHKRECTQHARTRVLVSHQACRLPEWHVIWGSGGFNLRRGPRQPGVLLPCSARHARAASATHAQPLWCSLHHIAGRQGWEVTWIKRALRMTA